MIATTARAVSGPALFARYAYPPNALGYCGPPDPAALLGAAGEAGHDVELAHLARGFEGAWPYLELIAHANGLADPLDARVVEAYWIGNDLLTRVPSMDVTKLLARRFERRASRRFDMMAQAALTGGVIQHSFHVFAVYPWLGLLRAGNEGAPLEVLDRCRIRWGRVLARQGEWAQVASRPLVFAGSSLVLGAEAVETVRVSDGTSLVDGLGVGDVVALHWDWVCDVLSRGALGWLRYATRQNLNVVNALAVPGPASACGA